MRLIAAGLAIFVILRPLVAAKLIGALFWKMSKFTSMPPTEKTRKFFFAENPFLFRVFGVIWLAVAVLGFRGNLIHVPSVEVNIRNESTQVIVRAVLKPERGPALVRENLKRGSSALIDVPISGESSYLLKIEFADGHVLEGGAGYVESGYRATETVTDDRIDSQVDL